jgi:uncharacterized protein (TIGR00661 family)
MVMKILYGVVGEGMGHATRSAVVLEHLLQQGHTLRVVVSGRAHDFLLRRFQDRSGLDVEEIHGLHLSYTGDAMNLGESVRSNLQEVPKGLRTNLEAYRRVAESGFRPDLVISDFESWAYLYGIFHRRPVISIDNMQVLHRCRHDASVTDRLRFDFQLARAAVAVKIPGAWHYVVTSFFFPPVSKKRTTLIPPILRPEILAARREPRDHFLVYQTAASNQALVPLLKKLPADFRVYGLGGPASDGNVTLCPFSATGFVEDLRTARGLIAGGGFSLMSEAVHLHVPILTCPIHGQYEQELNARYLASLGYGTWTPSLGRPTLESFLKRVDTYAAGVARYPSTDNGMLHACLEELLHRAAAGEAAPDVLDAPAKGKYETTKG